MNEDERKDRMIANITAGLRCHTVEQLAEISQLLIKYCDLKRKEALTAEVQKN